MMCSLWVNCLPLKATTYKSNQCLTWSIYAYRCFYLNFSFSRKVDKRPVTWLFILSKLKTKVPSTLQEQYKQEGTRILPSFPQVLLSQEAILTQQKHSLNTKCVVPTFKKEDKRSHSELDSTEHGITVGIPAEYVSN